MADTNGIVKNNNVTKMANQIAEKAGSLTNTGSMQGTGSSFQNHGVIDGSVINQHQIWRVVYPHYLANEEYANRRVTFIATEKTTSHYDTDSLASKLETVKSTFSSNLTEMAQNLSEYTGGKSEKLIGSRNTFFDLITKACVTLPLPNQFSENLTHNWNKTQGVVSSALGGAVNSAKSAGKDSGAIAKMISNMDTSVAMGAMAETLGIRKPLLDPNWWQNYTGTDPRAFAMEIDFVPKSQAEAETVKEIIKIFKAYSSPELILGGVSLNAPHYWNIIMSNSEIADMHRMDNLVLTQIQINYGQDGKMALHGDGMPKHIQMQLQFTESHVTYMQNYLDSYETWYTDRNKQMTNASSYFDDGKNAEMAKYYGLSTKPTKEVNK